LIQNHLGPAPRLIKNKNNSVFSPTKLTGNGFSPTNVNLDSINSGSGVDENGKDLSASVELIVESRNFKKNNTTNESYNINIEKIVDKEKFDKKTTIATSKKKVRVMICDDDQFILKSFNNMIKKVNNPNIELVCVDASNGLECLYKIYKDYSSGEFFDILFIDENMPVMNGNVCIKNLNLLISNKELNKIEIISTSSQQDKETIDNMLAMGVKQIVSKPIKLSDLKTVINEFCL